MCICVAGTLRSQTPAYKVMEFIGKGTASGVPMESSTARGFSPGGTHFEGLPSRLQNER